MALQKLINPKQELGFHSVEGMTLRYKKGTEWIVIPGVKDYTVSGTESPTRDVIDSATNISKRVARPRASMVTFNSLYLPVDRSWRELRDAQINRTLLAFRMDIDAELVWETEASGCTVDIATDGEVTFNGNDTQSAPSFDNYPIGRGGVIQVDDSDGNDNDASRKAYIINAVGFSNTGARETLVDGEVADTLFVLEAKTDGDYANPAAEVDDKAAKIYDCPPLQYEFVANVIGVMDSSMPEEGELDTTLTLQLRGLWPNPSVILSAL